MKVTVPAAVIVGPHVYRIAATRKAERKLTADGNLGMCDTTTSTILVMPGQSPTQLADTLLHEIIHAAFDQTPLRQGNTGTEEEIVSALTPILLGVLRNNPEFVELLIAP